MCQVFIIMDLGLSIVFVVKYRRKAISAEILTRLKDIFAENLLKWDCQLLDFNGESDHVHLLIEYKPDKNLSVLSANLKTVSSRLIRKEYPDLAKKYFYGKPHFWTGSYFVATCGGVTVEQLKKYVENQATPSKETLSC